MVQWAKVFPLWIRKSISCMKPIQTQCSIFVLEDEQGVVVGCAGFGPLPAAEPDICELKKMYYLPKARGKGYGRKMITICEEKAADLGYKRMYLETLGSMQEANKLYRASGFEPLSCAIGHTGHGSCDAYYMKQIG